MLSFVKYFYQFLQIKKQSEYQSHLQGEQEDLHVASSEKRMAGRRVYGEQKRAVLPAFAKKGVLTVEAAFVLPLFLLASMTLLGFAQVQYTQLTMIGPIHQTARKLARDEYVYAQAGEVSESLLGEAVSSLLTKGVSVAVAKSQLLEALEDCNQNELCINGGLGGISLLCSNIPDDEDMVDLVVTYSVSLPVQLISLPSFSVVQRCRVHCWVGYENEQEGQMVYVTETGSVYHTTLSCSYLQLSVQSVALSEVENLRNSSGGKYYPCESCGAAAAGTVYITSTGTRYHSSASCSRIKRGIRRISIDDVGSRHACSRCGG